jgi:hypothetical protein
MAFREPPQLATQEKAVRVEIKKAVRKAKKAFTRGLTNADKCAVSTDVISMGLLIDTISKHLLDDHNSYKDGRFLLEELAIVGATHLKENPDLPFYVIDKQTSGPSMSPNEKAKILKKQATERQERSDELGVGLVSKMEKLVCVFNISFFSFDSKLCCY